MRLASGLFACALSLSLGFLACSTFVAEDDPGADGGGLDASSAPDAGAAPVGFVVVAGQAGATEIVADETHVIWNSAVGVWAAAPMQFSPPVQVTTRTARSLQLYGDRVVFASDDTVYYADINGDMLDGGARSITPQNENTPIVSAHAFTSGIAYASASQLAYCNMFACGTNVPSTVDLDGAVGVMGSDPSGAKLWMTVGNELRSYETSGYVEQSRIEVEGGVRTFVVDDLHAFYAPNSGGLVLSRDLSSGTSATLASVSGGHPYAIALDTGYLYIAVFDLGTVLKVDKGTGAVTTIASGLIEPRAVAVTGTHVLVLSAGSIISYDKGL